jgi:GGDEF domain-containing protein
MCADRFCRWPGGAARKNHPLNTRRINCPKRDCLIFIGGSAAALAESVSVSAAENAVRAENSGLQNGIRWEGHVFEFGSVQIPELLFLSAVGIGLIFLLLYCLSSHFMSREVRRNLREPEPGTQRWTFFARGMREAELGGQNKDGTPRGLSIRDFPEEPQQPNFRLNRHRNTVSGFLNRRAWTELIEEYSKPAAGSAVGLIQAEGFKASCEKDRTARQNMALNALNSRLRSAVAGNVRIFHLESHEFLFFFPKTTEKELLLTLKTASALFSELLQEYGLPRTVLLGKSSINASSQGECGLPELFEEAFSALKDCREAGAEQTEPAGTGMRRARLQK